MSALEQTLGGPAIEVVAKATRRRFTVEYKRKILREAEAGKTPGAIGALLRREGLYSSHLTTWRAARERGELAGASKKRGPVPAGKVTGVHVEILGPNEHPMPVTVCEDCRVERFSVPHPGGGESVGQKKPQVPKVS